MVNTFNIVTPVYNSEDYITECIQSVLDQSCQNWQMVIVNDGSVDRTLEKAKAIAKGEHRITIIDVQRHKGTCSSHRLAHQAFEDRSPDDVYVHLDGDDRLLHSRVLEHVSRVYEAGADVTYGSYVAASGKPCVARKASRVPRAEIRAGWPYTHLRTFRAPLWNQVQDFDLRDNQGRYFSSAVDVAIMCPIIEAAEKVFFIDEPLYYYNDTTGFNEHSVMLQEQVRCALDIASR